MVFDKIMKKFKLKSKLKWTEDVSRWFKKLPKNQQKIVAYISIIAISAIVILLIQVFPVASGKLGGSGLWSGGLWSGSGLPKLNLPSMFPSKIKVENKTSFSTYLCGFMFQKNLTNVTVVGNFYTGNVTLYDYGTKEYFNTTITYMTFADINCYRMIVSGAETCICIVPV